MYPLLEDLLARIPSKYELVLLASLRAKQIIGKQQLGPTLEGEVDEDVKAVQSGYKPLSRALAEIARGELERDKIYLLEYLESFHRGDEDMPPPPRADADFGYVPEPRKPPPLKEGEEELAEGEEDTAETKDSEAESGSDES
jgi:DNA-directed RNA polymerase omega subunit